MLLFVDNTHAIGCLLKRSAAVRERDTALPPDRKRRIRVPNSHPWDADNQPHPRNFAQLPTNIRRCMNIKARQIWRAVTALDLVLWIEYVNTKLNIADLPSRDTPLPGRSILVGDDFDFSLYL